jgi:hypothetical protein
VDGHQVLLEPSINTTQAAQAVVAAVLVVLGRVALMGEMAQLTWAVVVAVAVITIIVMAVMAVPVSLSFAQLQLPHQPQALQHNLQMAVSTSTRSLLLAPSHSEVRHGSLCTTR